MRGVAGWGVSGTDPGRVEVVEFMRRNGGSASAAAHNFYPGLRGKELERITSKFRTWWQRHGGHTNAPPGPPPPPVRNLLPPHMYRPLTPPEPTPPPAPPPPEPEVEEELPEDLADLPPVERLKWQLGHLQKQHAKASRRNDVRALTQLDARIAAVGKELDEARSREGKVTKLDRLPAAVAAEVLQRHKALSILAGAHERMDESTEDRE